MRIKPVEKTERNLEFYKRWRLQGEDLYDLLREYEFSYARAYQIKNRLEKKYGGQLENLVKS